MRNAFTRFFAPPLAALTTRGLVPAPK